MTNVASRQTVVSPTEIPSRMDAAVLIGPGQLRVEQRPVPRPGPQEALVRVEMCGACGTDLKILDGVFAGTPAYGDYVPGHEWTGTVAALGAGVDEFAVGDRVCLEAHRGCGRCDNCVVGRYTACLNYGDLAKGHRAGGMTTDGGFAEYALHHVASLYRLPAHLGPADGVLITTAGTGLYGLHRAGAFVAGQDVAIFGPGPIGVMTALLCKLMGATRVILVGTRAERLERARELGIDFLVDARRENPAEVVEHLTEGAGVDLAVDASGDTEVPGQCLQVTKRGGRMLLLAFYPHPVSLDMAAAGRSDITVHTSRGEGGGVLRRAVALAAAGGWDGSQLVTHRFPLVEISEALRTLRERTGDPFKVVIEP
jgi:L-iditol 2-dehydrogenase